MNTPPKLPLTDCLVSETNPDYHIIESDTLPRLVRAGVFEAGIDLLRGEKTENWYGVEVNVTPPGSPLRYVGKHGLRLFSPNADDRRRMCDQGASVKSQSSCDWDLRVNFAQRVDDKRNYSEVFPEDIQMPRVIVKGGDLGSAEEFIEGTDFSEDHSGDFFVKDPDSHMGRRMKIRSAGEVVSRVRRCNPEKELLIEPHYLATRTWSGRRRALRVYIKAIFGMEEESRSFYFSLLYYFMYNKFSPLVFRQTRTRRHLAKTGLMGSGMGNIDTEEIPSLVDPVVGTCEKIENILRIMYKK